MKLSRIDLDGAGSPNALVARILKLQPDLSPPIPVEEIAQQLDILQINEMETDAFEGGLLTDEYRANGIILVNKTAYGGRRRFTIGHELGHFLIVTHAPVEPGKFLCSKKDMLRWNENQTDRYAQMEYEANEFSALLLMPPPILRKYLAPLGQPSLEHVKLIADHFEVSKEAAARSYAKFHSEAVAIVIVKDGLIIRHYRHQKFPKIKWSSKNPVPRGTVFHRPKLVRGQPSDLVQTLPDNWIDVEYGRRAPELYEQVLTQANGFAMILLTLEREDEEEIDREENLTSSERYRDRIARWQERRG